MRRRQGTVWATLFAWVLLGSPACSGRRDTEMIAPGASCRLEGSEMAVLETVLEQVVVGSGACAESGLVLVYGRTITPEFPETVEHARRRLEIENRIARGEEVDPRSLAALRSDPRGSSLEFENGLVLDSATVDAQFEREGCELRELQSPSGWELSRIGEEEEERVFRGDIVKGWNRLRRLYPEMACLVKLSAPGFADRAEMAVVSYSRMKGPLHGMGGFVVLEWDGKEWTVNWHRALWVS